MKIPDFFIVGAAKSGTTSLFNYLVQHPSIFIPSIKEPHYFSDFTHAGAPKLANVNEYLRLFRDCRPHQLAGDLSTSYLYSRRAPGRIRELQPNARIVIVLRNPIDRAYSFYWFNRNQFVENLSFDEAIDAEPKRIVDRHHFRFHYVESGKYLGQVERYFETFGPNSVKVYLFEDLVRDASGLCGEILSFLGVDSHHPIRTDQVFLKSGVYRSELLGRVLMLRFPGRDLVRRVVPTGARSLKHRLLEANTQRPPKMTASMRARLADTFQSDIQGLAELLGRDLSHWLTMQQSQAAAPSAASAR